MKNIVALGALLLFALPSQASHRKSICGVDDRVPSSNPKVARSISKMTDAGGCTLTMISKTCAISAGHCGSTFGLAEFNTPASRNGRIQHPAPEDIYPVKVLNKVYNGLGDDWAVLKVAPNAKTGALAGEQQGFYEVTFDAPAVGETVRITGYGLDQSDPERNLAQQTHTGDIVRLEGNIMYHIADTMGGNSGSSIIRESDEKIVAIHTNGGCHSRGGSNSSTMLSKNPKLKEAILACLSSEQ